MKRAKYYRRVFDEAGALIRGTSMKVNAVVLAGREPGDALGHEGHVSSKALIDINGKPMIKYVVEGLAASPAVQQIVVVGPRRDLEPVVAGPRVSVVEDGGRNLIDNLCIAARELPGDMPMLVSTSDIPLITGPIIDAYLELCSQYDADVYYPIVERAVNEEKYPLVRRTYATLLEGTFTGGNVVLVHPAVIEATAPKVIAFMDNRKNVVRLALLLGISFLLKLVLKRLSIPELEHRVSRLWDLRAKAVVCPFPEIGIDVDKPSDLQLARAALA